MLIPLPDFGSFGGAKSHEKPPPVSSGAVSLFGNQLGGFPSLDVTKFPACGARRQFHRFRKPWVGLEHPPSPSAMIAVASCDLRVTQVDLSHFPPSPIENRVDWKVFVDFGTARVSSDGSILVFLLTCLFQRPKGGCCGKRSTIFSHYAKRGINIL